MKPGKIPAYRRNRKGLYLAYTLRWGYVDNKTLCYLIYRNMIAKTLKQSHALDIWESEEDGIKVFQNEYPIWFIDIVNEVVQEIRESRYDCDIQEPYPNPLPCVSKERE
jgi:hypothetical protein